MSGLTIAQWHKRFEFQARWTREVRSFIFQTYQVASIDRILEVGCGTGAVLSDLSRQFPARYTGVDLEWDRLRFARSHHVKAGLSQARAMALPFPADAFKGAFCHYFLLWVHDPLKCLHEMARTVRPGGFVAAVAEPDYRGRIDYPEVLHGLGRLQFDALKDQGADPEMGRKLAELFSSVGLINIQVGILGAKWDLPYNMEDFDSEWEVLSSDLSGVISQSRLEAYKNADFTARQLGERILFLPTFYAVGQVRCDSSG